MVAEFDVATAQYSGRSTPARLHETYVLAVAQGATHHVIVAGSPWTVRHGDVILIDPHTVYRSRRIAEPEWSHRLLFPPESMIRGLLTNVSQGSPSFPRPVVTDAGLAAELLALHDRVMSGDTLETADETAASSAFRSALTHHGRRATDEHPAVRRAKEYIHANDRYPLRVADIAKYARMSTYHLIRVFHHAVGIPPYAYADQLRVARSQMLLRRGLPISEVACRAGFTDQSHLTRHFKRALGITPGVYTLQRS